jgi:hypothetical protein
MEEKEQNKEKTISTQRISTNKQASTKKGDKILQGKWRRIKKEMRHKTNDYIKQKEGVTMDNNKVWMIGQK